MILVIDKDLTMVVGSPMRDYTSNSIGRVGDTLDTPMK